MSAKQTFTVKLKANRNTNNQELTLEGDLGAGNAEALRKKLLSSDFKSDLDIRMQKIDTLDLTSIQVVYSLMKTLALKGYKSTVSAVLSDRHEAIMRNTGFTEFTRKQY